MVRHSSYYDLLIADFRSDCTKSCGGGTQVRKKTCEQSKYRKEDSAMSTLYYEKTCVGEESPQKRKQASEQTQVCNVQRCPGN